MAIVLNVLDSDPHPCAYLPLESATIRYKVMVDVSPSELDVLLSRGWRRFGPVYFRPVCQACRACVPLRIPVETFAPSRTQRRVAKSGSRFRSEIARPIVDDARLDLYARWHADRSQTRAWKPDEGMDETRYKQEFAFSHPSARELTLWDDAISPARLVLASIVDETPRALSAAFAFHDPAYRKDSLGTLAILREIELARRTHKRWLYLGYRVLGCTSSEYKQRFCPHELLERIPADDEAAVWTEVVRA